MAKKFTEQLSITVEPEQKESLQRHAEKRLTNVSQLVRMAIDNYLEKLALEEVYETMSKSPKQN